MAGSGHDHARQVYPLEGNRWPLLQGTGWTPRSVWTEVANLAVQGFDHETIQPPVSDYNAAPLG
jgi:hypothetical protein